MKIIYKIFSVHGRMVSLDFHKASSTYRDPIRQRSHFRMTLNGVAFQGLQLRSSPNMFKNELWSAAIGNVWGGASSTVWHFHRMLYDKIDGIENLIWISSPINDCTAEVINKPSNKLSSSDQFYNWSFFFSIDQL